MEISERIELERAAKFDYSKKDLLITVVEAIKSYRKFENKQEWQPVALDTSTITRYLAYGRFESFLGATQSPGWINLYNRVNYFLKKIAKKKGNKWIFYRNFEDKVENLLQDNSEIIKEENESYKLDEKQELIKMKKEMDIIKENKAEKNTKINEEMKYKNEFLVINFEDFIEKKEIFICNICDEVFYNREEALSHIKEHPLKLFLDESD
ncbi:MAG: C2H2-type zinc finger protein [Candidatus Heimdallarchaeaceae archaeon]